MPYRLTLNLAEMVKGSNIFIALHLRLSDIFWIVEKTKNDATFRSGSQWQRFVWPILTRWDHVSRQEYGWVCRCKCIKVRVSANMADYFVSIIINYSIPNQNGWLLFLYITTYPNKMADYLFCLLQHTQIKCSVFKGKEVCHCPLKDEGWTPTNFPYGEAYSAALSTA